MQVKVRKKRLQLLRKKISLIKLKQINVTICFVIKICTNILKEIYGVRCLYANNLNNRIKNTICNKYVFMIKSITLEVAL